MSECSAPDRLTDAFLRSSCFLPCYFFPGRPGVHSHFLSGCPHSAHQPVHRFLLQRVVMLPTAPAPGTSLSHLCGSRGSAPEAGFLGPLLSEAPPASSAKNFPEPWCLKPVLRGCTFRVILVGARPGSKRRHKGIGGWESPSW